ncbi:hypothetical protein, partial [Vreelandella titanicae]|uniref:hypothetical protein n=1 Tax=Vreelandella titanicae TaxID=664683 RepID=UPI003FD79241
MFYKWTHYTFSFLESRSACCAGSLQQSLRSFANPCLAVLEGRFALGLQRPLGHSQVDGLTLFVMRSLRSPPSNFRWRSTRSPTIWPIEWRQGQGVVEYRSQRGFAGEDMPRKPLDADGTTQASGSGVGSCREEERRPQRPSPRASRRRVRGVGQRPTVLGLAERSGKGFLGFAEAFLLFGFAKRSAA